MDDSGQLSRRSFCALGALAAAGALVPKPVMAAATAGNRALSFFNTHTSEELTSLYCCADRYEPDALAKINHILRDHRANEVKAIDIRVPDVPLKELRRAAVSLKGGGVGYYPDLNFVHVDVGRVRYW